MELINALIAMHCEGQNGQHGYHFERATEGYNGAVYCATDAEGKKLALKIARKSARNRAWREYHSTKLLHDLGIEDISPKPLSLHLDSPQLDGDLIISTWLEAENRVSPPAADEREAWLAILQSLSRVHSIKPEMTSLELPRAASPAQHPVENYGLIHQRLNELPTGQLGQFSYEDLAKVVQRIEANLPLYWEEAPELCLIHSDCHSANMLWQEGRVYFVDWENSGWADPALDIANMACSWRFMHLPNSHQDWLRGTYAEMRQDPRLAQRAEVYAIQLDMIWLILYSRMLRTRDDNPELVMRDSREFQETLQSKYYERIDQRLSQLTRKN
jgi:thiamine kinase-like enzyme